MDRHLRRVLLFGADRLGLMPRISDTIHCRPLPCGKANPPFEVSYYFIEIDIYSSILPSNTIKVCTLREADDLLNAFHMT